MRLIPGTVAAYSWECCGLFRVLRLIHLWWDFRISFRIACVYWCGAGGYLLSDMSGEMV